MLRSPLGLVAVVETTRQALANWRSTTALTVTLSATTGFVVLILGFAFHWQATRAREADIDRILASGLPHEVTHVILADLFPQQQIPRWADEGMAVLTEPREKIDGLLEDVKSRLLKANEKKTAALWEDQAKQLVR